MAQEIMVKDSLSKEMIAAGEELMRLLDKLRLDIDAALWLYDPENNSWKFIVASPEVKAKGPKKVYKQVQSALSKIVGSREDFSLKDVAVRDSKDSFIQLLRNGFRTVDGQPFRLSHGVIKGVPVGDAYIYRLT